MVSYHGANSVGEISHYRTFTQPIANAPGPLLRAPQFEQRPLLVQNTAIPITPQPVIQQVPQYPLIPIHFQEMPLLTQPVTEVLMEQRPMR
jgi:hypothetical protein